MCSWTTWYLSVVWHWMRESFYSLVSLSSLDYTRTNSDCWDYLIMFDINQIFYLFKAQIWILPAQWSLPWLLQLDYISPVYILTATCISTIFHFFESKDRILYWIVSSLWVMFVFLFHRLSGIVSWICAP